MSVPLTQAEQDLIGQVARFTEQRGTNGVYMCNGISKSLGVPVTFICALGEQALALNDLIMKAQVEQPALEVVKSMDDLNVGNLFSKRNDK